MAPYTDELTPKSWREGIIMIPDLKLRGLFYNEINIRVDTRFFLLILSPKQKCMQNNRICFQSIF